MKCKHFWFSVTAEYLQSKNKDVFEVLTSHRTIKKWAFILHDKDVYNEYDELENPEYKKGLIKPPHFHIYANFGTQSLDHTYFASWFDVNPASIKRIETTAANCLLYFVHGTEDAIAKGKYQYSWADVHHNATWSPQIIAEQVRYMGHFDEMSYKEQLAKIHEINDVNERIKLQDLLDKALACELKYRATFIDRFIQVVFVSGESGTGKTTFARQFVEKLNYFDVVPKEYWKKKPKDNENPFRHLDYGVSGSSNDVFQNYAGEDVYILDDMRDDSFEFADLLKFLDNHTNSPVKSRFVNKCFVGVMLIITSEKPLYKWYKDGPKHYDKTALKQLYRRISTYVVCKKDNIYLYNDLDDEGKPCGDYKVIENRTKDYYKDKPKPVNVSTLICDVFGEKKPDIINCEQIQLVEIIEPNDTLPF